MQKAVLLPVNSKQEIFLQDRSGHRPPPWGFFGGVAEPGETLVEALVRETKEELDINITPDDVVFLGSIKAEKGGIEMDRHLFLYKTDREHFDVLEGAGGSWLSYADAKEKLCEIQKFEEVWQMIKKHV